MKYRDEYVQKNIIVFKFRYFHLCYSRLILFRYLLKKKKKGKRRKSNYRRRFYYRYLIFILFTRRIFYYHYSIFILFIRRLSHYRYFALDLLSLFNAHLIIVIRF